MQKMIEFYHDKGIDMLIFGYTLPNLANICLHKSTDYKFYPFFSSDSDLLEKIQEDKTGGPSIAFTREAVANETFIRKTNSLRKSIVGIDASELNPHSMCQDMPTGLYTRFDYDEETQKFKARQNRVRTFENMVMSYFQATRPECETESYYTTGKQKKINRFSVDGYCNHCKTVFEAMGYYFHFCPCQKARSSLTDDDIKRGTKKKEMDELRKDYIREKGYSIEEMWECSWCDQFKNNVDVKNYVRTHFPFKRSLSANSLKQNIRNETIFGYVQCDLSVPNELKAKFSNFPPIFENIDVTRNNIGEQLKTYAEENNLIKQPQRMLISNFKLTNGTLITPIFNFYLDIGLQCTKIHRFVQYTQRKVFNSFVQSVFDARRAGDKISYLAL